MSIRDRNRQPAPLLLITAQLGFEAFQQGLATGDWQSFLKLITDDFTFEFPIGKFQGTHSGKEKAAEFFAYVSQFFPQGLQLTIKRVTWSDYTVVFEVLSEGEVMGKPYQNQAAISFDIRGEQICGYREYLGVLYQF